MIKSNNPTLSVLIVFALFFLFDAVVFHVLKGGMDRYYGLDKAAKIVSVGHSHSVLGIDAQQMEAAQAKVIQMFSNLADTNEKVIFLNYNKDYHTRHELFYDLRHLNAAGNALITNRLIHDLRPHLKLNT